MLADWTKWIVASSIVQVKTDLLALEPSLNFNVITQQVRAGDSLNGTTTDGKDVEFRYDGPWWSAQSGGWYHARYFVSLLFETTPATANIYDWPSLYGKGIQSLSGGMSIKKYGPAVGDDQSFIECLSQEGVIQVNNHGRRDVSANVFHTTMSTEYHGLFQEA